MIVVARPRYVLSATGVVHTATHRGIRAVRYLMTIPKNAKRCGTCRPK